jgi:hypothetical protein
MPLKKCSKCKQDKDTSLFYANTRMKDGLHSFCIVCHKASTQARKKITRADPVVKEKERQYRAEYRAKNQQFCNELTKKWRENNVQYIQQYSKTYRQENKAFVAYLCQKRKIDLLNRTPNWLTDDDLWLISEAYSLAALRTSVFGFSWHVDHHLPLRGKKVSGLHVPTNLQVIPAVENQRKTNKFEVSDGA